MNSLANASISASSSGGSRPTIPTTVNIHVLFSLRNNAIPVGRPGTGLMITAISSRMPGGSRSNWLEYSRRTPTWSSAGRPQAEAVRKRRCARTPAHRIHDQIRGQHPFASVGASPDECTGDAIPRRVFAQLVGEGQSDPFVQRNCGRIWWHLGAN